MFYVIVTLSLLLSTREVHADEGVNFAYGKATSQSSTKENGNSSRAVDGYKHPYYIEQSCMQTTTQYEPWWIVDLEHGVYVTSVRITNRADCCWENLINFHIRVGFTEANNGRTNRQCGPKYIYNVGAGQTLSVKCLPPLFGQFVSVSIEGSEGTLNFCELEVYGYQRANVFWARATSYGAEDVRQGKGRSHLFVDNTYSGYYGRRGHHIVTFNMTTGAQMAHVNYDTQLTPSVSIDMPLYLQKLPSEIFVFVILSNGGWNYYQTSIPILEKLSGHPRISDQLAYGDAWALLGYKGKLPNPSWRASVMKNLGYTPAIIEDVIPKLLVPPRPPSSVAIVELTSSSFTITWSRPSGIVSENELPLNYTVCVQETGIGMNSCSDNGASSIFYGTSLRDQTSYDVSVKAQSYAGYGPNAKVTVTTMTQGNHMMYVDLRSRIKTDTLYGVNSQPHSTIKIRGKRNDFSQAGHHLIVLQPQSGLEIMRGSFNTHQDSNSSRKMTTFLLNIPKPSIVLMVVYYQGHDYYPGSALQSICPNAFNYTSLESWSMICLYGYGGSSILNVFPWVMSVTSRGSNGPAVVTANISLPKELRQAPALYNVAAVSPRSLEIRWSEPDTDDYTGKLLSYQICYLKTSSKPDVNCSLISVKGNHTETLITRLHPFEEYEVKMRGVVALGYGPYSAVLKTTTPETNPSGGPTNISFLRVNTSSIFMTWAKPSEDKRNGIIREYSVCYRITETDTPESDCDSQTITQHTWFETNGLKPYQNVVFHLKAATSVGFGPAVLVSQRTLPSAPDGPPQELRVSRVDTTNITLSWLPPHPNLRNGRIINYTICMRTFTTSPGPCFMETVVVNKTELTVFHLQPYTKYIFKVTAATEIGFGPPAMLVNTTLQAEPSSAPEDLQVTSYTKDRIDIMWSAPDPSRINGILTKYSVCLRLPTSSSCMRKVVVQFTQRSYSFVYLRPFVLYIIEISAGTVAGYGPPANASQRTRESAPTGPPTRTSVGFVNETMISFSWFPPEDTLQNGVILYYTVCIREYGPRSSCDRSTQVLASEQNSYSYAGLVSSKEYIIYIRAVNSIGLGPPAFIAKTTGQCDLPVLHSSGHVKDDYFSSSGYLSRNYEPYQSRIDNQLPWCDHGSRKNAFIQVDLQGPLRILGVATKGHREHWQSWVSMYKVSYSLDGMNWKYVNVSGSQVITGNDGKGEVVQHLIDQSIITRFVRFEVVTFVGLHPCMGIELYACAPAIKPTGGLVRKKYSRSIHIEWALLPSVLDNGKLFGYKICYKNSSSQLPCETVGYVGNRVNSYTIKDVVPYTEYDVGISAGTIAGYGPPYFVQVKTDESKPSGPPRLLTVDDVTAHTLKLSWEPPEEQYRNGIIRKHGLCYQEATSEEYCNNIKHISYEKLSYEVTHGLRPNTNYRFIIMAATRKGWGPSAVVFQTTPPAAPSGPPTNVYATRIGPRILQIFWKPPEARKQNGEIIGYRVCIKEKNFISPCRNHVTLPETQLLHTVDNLKPYTWYNIYVDARTALGYGPAHYLNIRSGESAPSAPPKDVIIRSVSSHSIEIMWTAPNDEDRHGVLVVYEVVVYQELSDSQVRKVTSSSVSANITTWKMDDLSPLSDYIFHIKAGTKEGLGPAVIIHKRSDGRIGKTDALLEGGITAGGIAGGSILLVVLFTCVILGILWNKGMLPYTRIRNLKLQEEKNRRRKRRKRRKRRTREYNQNPEITKVHATDSIYSELNDYDAPQKRTGPECNLYGTGNIATENPYGTGNIAIENLYGTGNIAIENLYGTGNIAIENLYGTGNIAIENLYGTGNTTFEKLYGNALAHSIYAPHGNVANQVIRTSMALTVPGLSGTMMGMYGTIPVDQTRGDAWPIGNHTEPTATFECNNEVRQSSSTSLHSNIHQTSSFDTPTTNDQPYITITENRDQETHEQNQSQNVDSTAEGERISVPIMHQPSIPLGFISK